MDGEQLELLPNEDLVPVEDEEAQETGINIPVRILADANVFTGNIGDLEAVGIIMSGFDPDIPQDERVVDEVIFILSPEDGMEVARRLKAVAATVRPISKQITLLEETNNVNR